MEPKKLFRSTTNRMITGVCGGIAEYFNVDPTIIRLAAVILGFTGGGIVAYIVCSLVIPEQPMQ